MTFLLYRLDTGILTLKTGDPVLKSDMNYPDGLIDCVVDLDQNVHFWNGQLSYEEGFPVLPLLDKHCLDSVLASQAFLRSLFTFVTNNDLVEKNWSSIRELASYLKSI